jgi:hypothetical protein
VPSVLTDILGAVAPFIAPHAVISGRSQANWGDGVDDSAANFSFASSGFVPLGWATLNRYMALYNLDVSAIDAKAQFAKALLKFALWHRAGTPTTPFNILVHEMEGTLAAGTTWLLRSTGIPWHGGGYGPRPGYDFNATPLGLIAISGDLWATIPDSGATTTISASVDLDDAVQRARDERRPLPLLVRVDFPFSANAQLQLDHAPDRATSLHTTLVADWRPAIGIHGALEDEDGRPADLTNLHDPELAGTSNRTYHGAVEQGTISDEKKLWAVNHRRSGPRVGVVIGTSRGEPTAVDNSGSVSGIRLKSADAYDRDTTTTPQKFSPAGDYVVVPQAAATYSVEYTDESGVTTTLAEQGTGFTVVSMAADHTFLIDSKVALTIRAIKWRDALDALATTGLNTSDRFRFSVRADARTAESIDTLSMVRIMPPETRPFGNTADTLRARPLRNAFTQQCWASAIDRDIGGIIRTHLRMRDTGATDWCPDPAAAWVDCFVPGNDTFVSAKIATIYPSTDPLYPDELRLDVQLSAPNLALISGSAVVTGGVALNNLARMTLRQLNGAAALGNQTILLDSALPTQPAEVEIVDDAVGAQRVAVTGGTLTLQLAAPLAFTFPDGASVFVVFDPEAGPTAQAAMYSRPFFSNGKVPAAQLEGLYTGFYDAFEVKVV